MQALNHKNNNINITEPFKGLFTQGMVCHETYKDNNNNWLSPDEVFSEDRKKFFKKSNKQEEVKVGPSESMSKSKKNTIDPEEMINNYGADAVRLFIMSDSPPEKDVQWSDSGMEGSYKFIQKLWSMHTKIMEKILHNNFNSNDNDDLKRFTNHLIKKVTENIENFRYNVIIANFYEMYNFLNKKINEDINVNDLIENYSKMLRLMSPFIPHYTSHCLEELDKKKQTGSNYWPNVINKYLIDQKVNLVVQINGKKRYILSLDKDNSEKIVMDKIMENESLNTYIANKKIIKTVFIPNKIINLILE